MIDNKIVMIPHIDELCGMLKSKFLAQENEIKRLQEENAKLKSHVWEVEEMARLKAENERLHADWLRGFPISEEEENAIINWKKEISKNDPSRKRPYRHYVYKFTPTCLGTSGEIVDNFGNKFEFQEIG